MGSRRFLLKRDLYRYIDELYDLDVTQALKENILFFGDDITKSIAGENSFRYYMDKDLIKEKYKLVGKFTEPKPDSSNSLAYPDPDFNQAHSGFAGYNTLELSNEISKEINDNEPFILFVNTGTNDVLQGTDLSAFETHLNRLITQARESYPELILIISTIPYMVGRSGNTLDVSRFNDSIRSVVSQRSITVSPLVISEVNEDWHYDYGFNNNPDSSDYLTDNGLDPNSDGHRHIANRFLETLSLLGLLKDREDFENEARLFFNNVVKNNSSLSHTELKALSDFVTDCKEDGIWTNLLEVYPFAGQNLAGTKQKLANVITGVNQLELVNPGSDFDHTPSWGLYKTDNSSFSANSESIAAFNLGTSTEDAAYHNPFEVNIEGIDVDYSSFKETDFTGGVSLSVYVSDFPDLTSDNGALIGAYGESAHSWIRDTQSYDPDSFTDTYGMFKGTVDSANDAPPTDSGNGLWSVSHQLADTAQGDTTRITLYNEGFPVSIAEPYSRSITPENLYLFASSNTVVGDQLNPAVIEATNRSLGFAAVSKSLDGEGQKALSRNVTKLMRVYGRETPVRSGLKAWYRVDDSATINYRSQNVVTVDKIPNRINEAPDLEIANSPPLYLPRNNRALANFGDPARSLQTTLGISEPFTILLVGELVSSFSRFVSGNLQISSGFSANFSVTANDSVYSDTSTLSGFANSFELYFLAVRVDGYNTEIRVNEGGTIEQESGTRNQTATGRLTPDTISLDTLYMGNDPANTDQNGELVGELLVYDRYLADSEVDQELARTRVYWNI